MRTIEKRVVIPHGDHRAAVIGFVTYAHATEPVLIRRHGWEVADDIHDEFFEIVSRDNGKTWSAPRPSIRSIPVEGGQLVHTENTALFVPQRDRLIVLTNQSFQPNAEGGHTLGTGYKLHITLSRPEAYLDTKPFVSDFGFPQGVCISFCQPLLDARGRVIVPIQYQSPDPDGTLARAGVKINPATGLAFDYGITAVLIGTFRDDDHIDWQLSAPVPLAPGLSSRGLYEGAVAELRDGTLAMIMRGANQLWPDKPGCKYLSFSRDGGMTWSDAEYLRCSDGSLIESSATGSALFRSNKTGGLYWIGNLCLEGVRPYGGGSNMPRSPLYIARVSEKPFGLIRESITVIDRAAPHEHPDTQMSNFKLYQDRDNGDVLLYLARYGERGYDNNAWLNADHYEYRVRID